MKYSRGVGGVVIAALAGIGGLSVSQAQEFSPVRSRPDTGVINPDTECSFFAPGRERFLPRPKPDSESQPGRLTRQFTAMRATGSLKKRKAPFSEEEGAEPTNLIDDHIWRDLRASNVAPAGLTTDYEFIRRVSLDLTGRIPKAARVNAFVEDPNPKRRAALVNELLDSSAWVDKWTMYFGDHFRNTSTNLQVQLRPEGRNALYKYLHDSIAANKPYNVMASELIAAEGTNSFDQQNGQMNYVILGESGTGPAQDGFDSMTAKIAREFLGLSHLDCVLCHSGRGHLEPLSLWGSRATRADAWGMAAFLSRTRVDTVLTPVDPNETSRYSYFTLLRLKTDYNLNTTTGNRPPRQPIGTTRTLTPVFLFGGKVPDAGEDYRPALARFITSDFQFARATVNYIWAEFFGRGIVDPPDQFDPARLDPDNPPPEPWTLQPSNPYLLNALARNFIESGYDLKALMRLIATSDTYQLSSEYAGDWDPAWEKYFARHFVRRLWAEEIHDAIVSAVDTLPVYTVNNFSLASTVYGVDSPGFGNINFAMQAPDVVGVPGRDATAFLDVFMRGNRDDQQRKSAGSVPQALGLMNDTFVQNRIRATGSGANASYLARVLVLANDGVVEKIYLDVLSRYPTQSEREIAVAHLDSGTTAALRRVNAEDLLWSLFNKVDFFFNY